MATTVPVLRSLTSPFSPKKIFSPPHRRTTRLNTKALPPGSKGFGIAVSEKRDDEGRRNPNGGDEADEIPQVVFDRMVRRIVVAVGLPMGSGLLLLYVLGSLKESGLWDVPVWLPFASTLLSFGTSALGIAYGTLSTSWDPERDGSFFGWEEASVNWPKLWEEEDNEKRL